MFHIITINFFEQSDVWIWNRFRVRFKCKLWRVNLIVAIINIMMIKYPNDSWKQRPSFGRIDPWFEVIFCRLDVPLSWWLSCLITMKRVELVHLSSKTWWEEVRATDGSYLSLVSNSSTAFANNIMFNEGSWNNWLYCCCINIGGRQRTKIMRALNWNGQCSWGLNY